MEAYAEQSSDDSTDSISIEELSNLSETQRQALEFRFNQELSFQEIAEQMQTSADNSRQIISRAIRKLRTLMVGKEAHHEKN